MVGGEYNSELLKEMGISTYMQSTTVGHDNVTRSYKSKEYAV
jgi:hypothetical protein